MNKKRKRRSKTAAQVSKVPDWVLDDTPAPKTPYTKRELDDLAADVQTGIQDTPSWREYVRRFGEKEAARILKAALFSRHFVQGDPNN